MSRSDGYQESFRLISAQLHPGESLIWYDRPPRGQLMGRWALLFVFMLLWTGFAVLWSQQGVLGHVSVSPLLAAPLILLGIVCCALLAFKVYCVSGLHYGLTDKRVITVNSRTPSRIHSYGGDWLTDISVFTFGDRGTIVLSGPAGKIGRERVELFRVRESSEVAEAIKSRLL